MQLTFTATIEQRRVLQGLAYWIADINYISERYGHDVPEITECDRTIKSLFDELDALNVPFWVQNSVICWAENWRNYKNGYLTENMKIKNIYL